MKPITPDEVVSAKRASIPDFVIQAFNETIARHWNGHESCFTQEEVFRHICHICQIVPSPVFQNHWLDVEQIYREAGWKVTYDAPAYSEDYKAFFRFTFFVNLRQHEPTTNKQ